MNDDTLDRAIRAGLVTLMDRAQGPAPFPVDVTSDSEPQVQARPRRGPGFRRVQQLSIAAALVFAVVGLAVWSTRGGDGTDIDAVHPAADEPRGFEGWEPGWHTIDTGPVTAMNGAQLSWTGSRLIVAGYHDSPADGAVTQVFEFDPETREWVERPRPPREINRVVAAGDVLVAVGHDDRYPDEPLHEWATLAPGDEEWTEHGAVPLSPVLAGAGVTSTAGAGRDRLVWTGERVIDVGLGAVMDPTSGTADELPLPSDVVAYSHLLGATPVWTGDALVLAGWSALPGLSWNATGTSWQDVPGPEGGGIPPSTGSAAAAAAAGSQVVLVGEGTASVGYAASVEPATGGWTRLPDLPGPSNSTCPYRLAAVGGAPIVQPCGDAYETPLRLADGAWHPIGPPPFAEACCMGAWLGTDEALVTWSTDIDTLNNPRAPYVEGAVWIPPAAS